MDLYVAMVTAIMSQSALNYCPTKAVKIFIACLHGQKLFFVIFHRFKRVITI